MNDTTSFVKVMYGAEEPSRKQFCQYRSEFSPQFMLLEGLETLSHWKVDETWVGPIRAVEIKAAYRESEETGESRLRRCRSNAVTEGLFLLDRLEAANPDLDGNIAGFSRLVLAPNS